MMIFFLLFFFMPSTVLSQADSNPSLPEKTNVQMAILSIP
jgi:hypothetical protein